MCLTQNLKNYQSFWPPPPLPDGGVPCSHMYYNRFVVAWFIIQIRNWFVLHIWLIKIFRPKVPLNPVCGPNRSVRIHGLRLRWFQTRSRTLRYCMYIINPLKPELNSICYLLALLGAHHFLHVSRIMVKSLTFRRLMSYIYTYIYIYIYIWSTHSWCF